MKKKIRYLRPKILKKSAWLILISHKKSADKLV